MVALRKLNRIFDRTTKVRALILLVAIIIGGFIEMLALSLISPFVSILMDNTVISSNNYIRFVYELFRFSSTGSFLAALTFLLAAIYIFRGVYIFALSRVKIRFTARRQAYLSEKLLEKLLRFSYLYHTRRNIAELQRIISGDVNELFLVLNGSLQALSEFFMMLFVMILLLIVSPLMTLCIIALALLCVLVYFKVFRKKIRQAGVKSRNASISKNKAILQAFGGIKEVKVSRREEYFIKAFKVCNVAFIKASTHFRVLDAVPKLVIEVVCFSGALILLGFFILGGADVFALVPQISLFVLAAFRILPAISAQVRHINTVIYHRASIDAVYKSLYEECDIAAETDISEDDAVDSGRDIVVQNLKFKYPLTMEPVLENVSFTIPANKSLAFVGPSGAGKTTLVDLILGVLSPDAGGVFYEGKSIHCNFDEWSRQIGYIPQHIYLLDESILENVAFGIERNLIDESKVWRALEQAQLKEFVESLPDGVNTLVGDRGVRLSGGQRQRVGIARAMYEDPPVLVLDEATSSLDDETEKAVMDAVIGFQGNKTMLIVAHRLSTIEHCDVVYRVEDKTVTRER